MNRMWMGLTLVAVGISGCCAGLEFGAEARVPPWSVHAVVLFCALLVPAGAGLLALHARGAPKERPVRGGARNLPAGGDPAPEEWDYELPLPVLSRLDAIAGRLPTEDLEGLRVMLRDGLLPLLPSRLGWGCTRCGIDAPRRKVTLTRNTGMLVLRRHETLEGEFCGPCLRSLAGDVALHNLALGWWGVISAFVNLAALPQAVFEWEAAKSMKAPPEGAEPPRLDEASTARIAPAAGRIVNRLLSGLDPGEVYEEEGSRLGVLPAQVLLFIAALAGGSGEDPGAPGADEAG